MVSVIDLGASISFPSDAKTNNQSRYRIVSEEELHAEEAEIRRIKEEIKSKQKRPKSAQVRRPGSFVGTDTIKRQPHSKSHEVSQVSKRPKPDRSWLHTPPPPMDEYDSSEEDMDMVVFDKQTRWSSLKNPEIGQGILEELKEMRKSKRAEQTKLSKLIQQKADAERHRKSCKQPQDKAKRKRPPRYTTSPSKQAFALHDMKGAFETQENEWDECLPPYDKSKYEESDGSDYDPPPFDEPDEWQSPEAISSPVFDYVSAKIERKPAPSYKKTQSSLQTWDLRRALQERSGNLDQTRRSCSYFEDKQRREAEAALVEAERIRRLRRAHNAHPPIGLLERQEAARKKKEERTKELEKELYMEFSPAKRVQSREVPLSTYISPEATREMERSERIKKRSTELLSVSALPPRMASATSRSLPPEEIQMILKRTRSEGNVAGDCAVAPGKITIRMKQQLREAEEEEERKRQRRPKPVPDFDALHSKWEKKLQKTRARVVEQQHATTTKEFFTSRAATLEELQARKEARRQRMAAKREEERHREEAASKRLFDKVMASGAPPRVRPTKADELRVKKRVEMTVAAQKKKEQEEVEEKLRRLKMKAASKALQEEVIESERRKRDEYAGGFVDLREAEAVAIERAKEQRKSFREAIRRNKERLQESLSSRPSLMERFTTDFQRQQHKKKALETVVKKVFKSDKKAMKAVLNDDEREYADDFLEMEGIEGGEHDEG